jgi:hypothetical protein
MPRQGKAAAARSLMAQSAAREAVAEAVSR